MQEDIADLQSSVDVLPNSMRKFFFIGDSYMQGYTPGSETQKGWAFHVIEMMHLTEGVNAFQLNSSDISGVTTGGWGMAPTDGDNHTAWSDLVSNISSSASIPFSEITDVVILGGTNDEDYFSSIETGMNNLDTAIRTKFPNVKRISLGVLAWVNIKRFRDYVRPVYNAYARCVKKGWHFFRNIVWAAHRFSYISSDGIHLTQVGYYDVASYIVDCIINGDCNVQWNQNVKIDTPSTSGITSTHTDQYIEFNFLNGIHTIRFNGTHVNGSSNAIGFTLSTAIAAIGYYGIAVLPDFVMSLSLTGDNGNVSLTNLYKLSGNQDIVHMSLILRDRQIQLQERLSGGLTAAMDVINYNPLPVTVSGWDM